MIKTELKINGDFTKAKSSKLHIGLCKSGIALENDIRKLKLGSEIVIHRFEIAEELYEHYQRSYIDLVIFASGPDMDWLGDSLRRIKVHPTLMYIPILIYAPRAGKELIVNSLMEGADDFTSETWDSDIISAKVNMLIARSQRDVSLNPSTRLPGPNAIEYEIDRRLRAGQRFAVCYGDIDNFKAYNDYHGYVYGDKMIKLTAHIIRNVVYDLTDDGFMGHIGGDDFIFLIPVDKIEPVCKNILSTFDRMVPFRYSDEDRERGWIKVENRRGEIEQFPITTLSIAVIINQKKVFKHPGEMSHMMADLKKYTKSLPGSNYMIERRNKY
ncbi:MAG: diguanylate cyclase [candidate division Zixibacteria bacterium]